MFYPDEIIQEVRAQNDIVDVVGSYVPLRMRGGRHWGLCPFHQENTPSFTVNNDTQFFHCFGCGAGGNVLTFVMRIEHMDFVDALKLLADRIHFILPQPGNSHAQQQKHRERSLTAEYNKQAARFFYDNLQADTPEAEAARKYLENRGVSPKMQALFGLGLAPPGWDGLLKHLTANNRDTTLIELHNAGLLARSHNNEKRFYDRFRGRLMFPIIAPDKRVVGFGGRIMDNESDEAKYLNSPETSLFSKSSQLYALNLARRARAKELVIVEGYMDVLALYNAGITNAVGVLGTALTTRHVQILRRAGCETALLLLDSDTAGTNAAQKSVPLLLEGGLRVKVLQVPDAKDPDEFLQKFGKERLGTLLRNAKGHTAFQLQLAQQPFDMEKTDDRIRYTQEAAALLAPLNSEIETDAYVQEIAHTTQIAPSAIFAEIKKQREKNQQNGDFSHVTPRRRVQRTNDPGLRDAKKALLCTVLSHPIAAAALQNFLLAEEMGDAVLSQLLAFAYDFATQNEHQESNKSPPAPPDIVSRFKTAEEQQQAFDVFSKPIAYSSVSEMEKSLNEMYQIIKRAHLDTQIETDGAKNDLNAVNIALNTKKTLQNQYISLANG
ncbi:MAG: DNA primase [Defluviitaleaceae bacterium]|nr:DNA primase [Defluviitaleaceae bacterium]